MFGLVVLIVLALAVTPLLSPADSTKRPQDGQATAARQVVLGPSGAEAGGRAISATSLLSRR
jgi:hypothetical protein